MLYTIHSYEIYHLIFAYCLLLYVCSSMYTSSRSSVDFRFVCAFESCLQQHPLGLSGSQFFSILSFYPCVLASRCVFLNTRLIPASARSLPQDTLK